MDFLRRFRVWRHLRLVERAVTAITITLTVVLVTTAAISQEVAYRDTNPAISPNGRYVAFYSDRSGNDDEYLLELETGQVRRPTDP